MAFRAFLFSSDSTASSELCQILTDLGIEAEICAEMLVAVERVTKESFDALIVDWDHQTEAMFLIKSVRELKSAAHLLTLAIVQNDTDLPVALQAGANSAIRKPIDPRQTHDTLSTAKQLIEARQQEVKAKEERLASTEVPLGPDESDLYGHEDENTHTPRPGFIQQTAPRSAFEAIESVAPEPAEPAPPPRPEPSDSQVRARAMAILGYGPKPEPSKPAAQPRPTPKVIDFSGADSTTPRDSGGVFSSLPESHDLEEAQSESGGHSKFALYTVICMALVAAVLWVFAPGNSYISRLKRFELQHSRPASPADQHELPDTGHDTAPQTTAPVKTTQPIEPDPEITSAEDDATANVQVIENKPIPPAGAQQPPSPDPQPNLGVGQSPNATRAAQTAAEDSQQPSAPGHENAGQPNPVIQSISAPQGPVPPAPQAVAPTPAVSGNAPSHVPDEGVSPLGDSRSGVVIPESLKGLPAPAPASSLDPPDVPEETSRPLVVRRIEPLYPAQAIQQRLDGPVVLQVRVAKDGTVRDLKLLRGYFLLGRAAYDAVKQWRFKPYAPNGKPIEFLTNVTIVFKFPT